MHASSLSPGWRSLAIALILLAATLVGLTFAAPRAGAAGPFYAYGSICKGTPSVTWVTGDTWILNASAVVDLGCVLTIEPGVTVMADPGVHLYVNGTLNANGIAGNAIKFLNNQTAVTSWAGIQFNPGSTGSVTWSNFTRVQVAVAAKSSSPAIENNTILLAAGGLRLESSASLVADNEIDGQGIGAIGVILASSTASLERNRINGTVLGIQTMTSGSPTIVENQLSNISGGFALGMFIDHQTSVNITGNVIQGVRAKDATAGGQGNAAAGILTNATASVTIAQNSITGVQGGLGGAGPSSVLLAGSPGGNGGPAAGIAIGGAKSVLVEGNTLSGIRGGRGGDGGQSGALAGGKGGIGGYAIGIELFSASGNVSFLTNTIQGAGGGDGGAGGQGGSGSVADGAGGAGGDAYGLFSLGGQNASLSGNTVESTVAGSGGSSLGSPASRGVGGSGGNVTGLIAVVNGLVTFHANTVSILQGGTGGNGHTQGGFGGNVTGLLALGFSKAFNSTTMSYNVVSLLTGGAGGIGGVLSGDGGNVTGIMALHVNVSLSSNQISAVQGGAGGSSYILTNQASGGGEAGGVALVDVPLGSSVRDSIQTVTGGAPGGIVSPRVGRGVGYYFAGNNTIQTQVQVTNGTIAGIGNYSFYVDNYTTATTLNTPFSGDTVAVMAAGNLTVQNYLGVQVYWPNNSTLVQNPSLLIEDDSATAFSGVLPNGQRDWFVVTNREYIDSSLPTYHVTNVSVSYGSYAFWNNPRLADMNASHTESFGMVDSNAPTSLATTLPPYETAWTFPVSYTETDRNGTGAASVTLWYLFNGGAWTAFQTQTAPGLGTFTFTATADGVYAFATIATDRSGNVQQPNPPIANDTWTIVDTTVPGSRVVSLPRYETSLSFTVRWAPDAGVTDIVNYTVQVNTGLGWVSWLTGTTATSATFTATGQGPVAFRTLATDLAGNGESKSINDTWTMVDAIAPQAIAAAPAGNLSYTPTALQITFSEPMNESAVEMAFSIAPVVPGAFSWSNGSTTLRFQLTEPVAAGTSYAVTIDTRARDLAGNGLTQAYVFTFATPAPPASGLSLVDLWPLLVVVAAALAALAFFLVRRRGATAPEAVAEAPKPAPVAAPPKQEAAIDDVFLLYRRDGVLIKHETRRLRPDIDTDILSGMLTAVQQFVKDSFHGDEGEELNEMTVGQMHILIGRGKWLVLAATLTGGDVESMTAQIQKCVADMEDHNWDRLEDWDGDLEIAKALGPYLKKLIRGEYAAPGS